MYLCCQLAARESLFTSPLEERVLRGPRRGGARREAGADRTSRVRREGKPPDHRWASSTQTYSSGAAFRGCLGHLGSFWCLLGRVLRTHHRPWVWSGWSGEQAPPLLGPLSSVLDLRALCCPVPRVLLRHPGLLVRNTNQLSACLGVRAAG